MTPTFLRWKMTWKRLPQFRLPQLRFSYERQPQRKRNISFVLIKAEHNFSVNISTGKNSFNARLANIAEPELGTAQPQLLLFLSALVSYTEQKSSLVQWASYPCFNLRQSS
jgi:hypothetical protein